jgi:hypothetical protein
MELSFLIGISSTDSGGGCPPGREPAMIATGPSSPTAPQPSGNHISGEQTNTTAKTIYTENVTEPVGVNEVTRAVYDKQ